MTYYNHSKIAESEIQALYERFPYLIEPKFVKYQVFPQKNFLSGYADIFLILNDDVVIVELKVDPLDPTHLLQLRGYLEDYERDNPAKPKPKGILIGFPSKSDDLSQMLGIIDFFVEIKHLYQDVPVEIEYCKKCRMAKPQNTAECYFCNHPTK